MQKSAIESIFRMSFGYKKGGKANTRKWFAEQIGRRRVSDFFMVKGEHFLPLTFSKVQSFDFNFVFWGIMTNE